MGRSMLRDSGLRDYQMPRKDLPELAHGIAERPGCEGEPDLARWGR